MIDNVPLAINPLQNKIYAPCASHNSIYRGLITVMNTGKHVHDVLIMFAPLHLLYMRQRYRIKYARVHTKNSKLVVRWERGEDEIAIWKEEVWIVVGLWEESVDSNRVPCNLRSVGI